jgi:hypothetical protein
LTSSTPEVHQNEIPHSASHSSRKDRWIKNGSGAGVWSTVAREAERLLFAVAMFAFVSSVVLTGCIDSPRSLKPSTTISEWHEFAGTWNASGSRDIMRLGGDRRASISTYSGTLMLAGPSRPDIGFRSEAIVFTDSATGLVGRAVWTDEHGDAAFSELRGEGTAINNRIVGTFVGGTGRFAGARGGYEFAWKFVLDNGEGGVQGQSVGLHGRLRIDPQQGESREGVPR